MKEFMFLIRNQGDAKAALSLDQHLSFIKQCEVYIEQLKSQNKLIAAQPLVRTGVIISKSADHWNQENISPDNLVQVGYYHIYADDLDDAIKIAKNNPEFAFVTSATIEVRPIKSKEAETGFVYPVNQ